MLPRRFADRLPCVAWFVHFQYNPIPYLPYLLSYLPLVPNPTVLYLRTEARDVAVCDH